MTHVIFETLQKFSKMFEMNKKDRMNLYDKRDDEIQRCLRMWADSIPESYKKTYGRRILRIQTYIQNRKFTFGHYNPRFQEVVVYYGRHDTPEMIISITRDKILSKDSEYTYKEIIFPYTWSTDKSRCDSDDKESFFYVEEVSQIGPSASVCIL